MSSEAFFSIFKTEAAKQAERAEKQKEEEERENAKVRLPTFGRNSQHLLRL
jgi:hypothetical protein